MEIINYSDYDFSFPKFKPNDILKHSKNKSIFLYGVKEFSEKVVKEFSEKVVDDEILMRRAIWQDNSEHLLHFTKKGLYEGTLDAVMARRLLRLACRLDSVNCAKVLLEGEIETVVLIDEMDSFGLTPLHNAAEVHAKKCIDLLLRKNARTDIRSNDKNSLLALEIALSSKRVQVDWSPKESVAELLVLLRERDFSAIMLLARATKQLKNVAYKMVREGRAVELELLILFAADNIRKDGSNMKSPYILLKTCVQNALCMDRKIFVGGLPGTVNSEYLKEIFQEEFGPIESATVMYTRASDGNIHSRGFGFVIFKKVETADVAIHSHSLTILGKEVEIKSALSRNSLETEAIDLSQPQHFLQKLPDREPTRSQSSSQLPNRVITTGQISPKTGCHAISSSLSERSLPQWVTRFRQWLPNFLREACKRLPDGEWYPLSSIKGDFRATCGMEMDHVSLGFLKLSDFMRSFPGLCRMKTVPTGNGRATHMVIYPSHSSPHNQLLQMKGAEKLVTAYPSYQPSNVNLASDNEFSSLGNTYSECPSSGGGGSNPDRTVIDSICQRLGTQRLNDYSYLPPWQRPLPPPSDGSTHESTSGQSQGFSLFVQEWWYYVLQKGFCTICFKDTTKPTWYIVPCKHKVCTECKDQFEGDRKKCIICSVKVVEVKLIPPRVNFDSSKISVVQPEKSLCTVCSKDTNNPTLFADPCLHTFVVCTTCKVQFEGGNKTCIICSDKVVNFKPVPTQSAIDYPKLQLGEKQSKRSANRPVCLIKEKCKGSTASVSCMPCRHTIACLDCIPWSASPNYVNLTCPACGCKVDGIEFPDV